MYETLMYFHLATVIPCFFIGTILLLIKKGSLIHKRLGKIYMSLMFVTAWISLFMEAKVGPTIFNHFGWIHSFSLLTIYVVPTSLRAIKRGQRRRHQIGMILLYVGAILIAGGLTFTPGRYMHSLFFN